MAGVVDDLTSLGRDLRRRGQHGDELVAVAEPELEGTGGEVDEPLPSERELVHRTEGPSVAGVHPAGTARAEQGADPAVHLVVIDVLAGVDLGHPAPAGHREVGVQDQAVHPVQPGQRLAADHEDAPARQVVAQFCEEGVATQASWLVQAGEQHGAGAAQALGGGQDDPTTGERGQRRPTRIGLQWPFGQRHGPRRVGDRRGRHVIGAGVQLWLALLEQPSMGPGAAQRQAPLHGVHRQGERALGQGRAGGVEHGQGDVGRPRAHPRLQLAAKAGLVLDEAGHGADLDGDRARPEHAGSQRDARADGVGGEGDGGAADRLTVAGLLDAVVGEPLVTDAVAILDGLDDVDQLAHVDRVAVEGDDHPAGDAVDLGPVHALQASERRGDPLVEGLAAGVLDGLDLDVGPALAGPHATPVPAPRRRQREPRPGSHQRPARWTVRRARRPALVPLRVAGSGAAPAARPAASRRGRAPRRRGARRGTRASR
ncbi:MAG: hypothetical protein R2726_15625 [Acidimicrobiales bacterium]